MYQWLISRKPSIEKCRVPQRPHVKPLLSSEGIRYCPPFKKDLNP